MSSEQPNLENPEELREVANQLRPVDSPPPAVPEQEYYQLNKPIRAPEKPEDQDFRLSPDEAIAIVEANQSDGSPESYPALEIDSAAMELFNKVLQEARIQSMLAALREHDAPTADHVMRVGMYAAQLAYKDGLGIEDVKSLTAAGLLHDIGKVAVPVEILRKKNQLEPEEFAALQHHPQLGYEETSALYNRDKLVPELVQAHHCFKKKNPYTDSPDRPQHIMLESRVEGLGQILATADAFDALFSDRNYNETLPYVEKVKRLKAELAADPKYALELLRLYNEQGHNVEHPVEITDDQDYLEHKRAS